MKRALLVGFFLSACASQRSTPPQAGPASEPTEPEVGCKEVSVSFYANLLAGRETADGGRYDPTAFTAANRHLPFGTKLRLELEGRTTEVTINDRGPYVAGRTLDLSRAAAEALGIIKLGHARVKMCRE